MYWIEFKERNLKKFQEKLNWRGDGTEWNPFIIESMDGLSKRCRFKGIKSSFIIRNLELSELDLINCQNITFESCKVYKFRIKFCHDLKIENSSIANFNVSFSKGNVFKNNTFGKYSGFTGEKIGNFELYINFLLAIFFLVFIGLFISSGAFWLSILMSIGFFLFLKPTFSIIKKRFVIRKFPDNLFENNIISGLDELNKEWSAFDDI